MIRSLRHPSRETAVAVIAGVMLVFTGWAWGGVILWAQHLTCGLGAAALCIALFPPPHQVRDRASLRRILQASLVAGGLLAGILAWNDLRQLLAEREATISLIPGAILDPLAFSQWGLRGIIAGFWFCLSAVTVAAFLRPSDARGRLLRFPVFWLGLLVFAWVACQALNPWGVVVHRDLIWKIAPQEHITWLPSGIDAPFNSTEEPGGMNGWRQLLILAGPWALLCALRAAVVRRRSYAWLAALAVVNAVAVAVVGNIVRAEKWPSFLGVAPWEARLATFGPFAYKNHAAAWLCLALALGIALMFQLAKRKGDKVDRGGPHLLIGGLVVILALCAGSTMSFGGAIVALTLVLVVTPAAYFLDRQLRANLSPAPAIVMVALGAVVAYAGLLSADAQKWRQRLQYKQAALNQTGEDDRAPLRRVTWRMISDADLARHLSGWGGGSYRWVSPSYMATEPAFLDKKGRLFRRASFAHSDWLQAIAEWGLAGWIAVATAAAFLVARGMRAWARPRAPALALFGGLTLFALHAGFDFLLFQPQLVLLAILVCWLLVLEHDAAAQQ